MKKGERGWIRLIGSVWGGGGKLKEAVRENRKKVGGWL